MNKSFSHHPPPRPLKSSLDFSPRSCSARPPCQLEKECYVQPSLPPFFLPVDRVFSTPFFLAVIRHPGLNRQVIPRTLFLLIHSSESMFPQFLSITPLSFRAGGRLPFSTMDNSRGNGPGSRYRGPRPPLYMSPRARLSDHQSISGFFFPLSYRGAVRGDPRPGSVSP